MSTLPIAEAIHSLLPPELPVRVAAYDGSRAGDPDAPLGIDLRSERGLAYVLTAPGDLGFARAYISGELVVEGAHPGNPYPLMNAMRNHHRFRRPSAAEIATLIRSVGLSALRAPAPPDIERMPRWKRNLAGLSHSMQRDAAAIEHHYDVSNRFYEMVLGPSMTYTCAVFPHAEATLEEAQTEKYDLVCRKLALRPGDRLLDVGCGWGGMVVHAVREYGVRAIGVTLSRQQVEWGQKRIAEEGLADLAEIRHQDYRAVPESGFDAISSIGMTEHIGVANYPAYFTRMRDLLRPGGRFLNHCITRPHNHAARTGAFIDRYVFPDGELIGSGRVMSEIQDAGLEAQHAENLREHYARTLRGWSENLERHWEACVAEVGDEVARVWGLYMCGSRIAFERDEMQLFHVLAARTDASGAYPFELRPDWRP